MKTSQEYDDKIARYEQQLKEFKAKRRELRTAEARKARAKAEELRQKELLQNGQQVEAYRLWMSMTLTTWGGRQISLLDLYEETKDDGRLLFIGQLPEEWSGLAEHQGADATQPEA